LTFNVKVVFYTWGAAAKGLPLCSLKLFILKGKSSMKNETIGAEEIYLAPEAINAEENLPTQEDPSAQANSDRNHLHRWRIRHHLPCLQVQ
jgi:hypothetical protein